MLGLWRGCTRYLPGSYMCMDEFPEEEVLSDDEDSSENPCKSDSEVLMLIANEVINKLILLISLYPIRFVNNLFISFVRFDFNLKLSVSDPVNYVLRRS
jgi:hypothetical protein